MAYWLMKSEPDVWSWEMQAKKGTAPWDGVRNYQARNNMKAMKRGDRAFFYHSNIGREIVGVVDVVREHYSDPADPRFVLVDVKAAESFEKPVTLAAIKVHPKLQNMKLVTHSRLSVQPVSAEEWAIIYGMAEK